MNNLKITRKIEITIQVETEGFVIEDIEPVSKKNMLLMNLKNKVKDELEVGEKGK